MKIVFQTLILCVVFGFTACHAFANTADLVAVGVLDSALSLAKENQAAAGIIGGWAVNALWKLVPGSKPMSAIIKVQDVLRYIVDQKIFEKLLELAIIVLGILDVICPVPNLVKKPNAPA